MIRRLGVRFDAAAFALALSLQLAPSIPAATATPVDLGIAWHGYARLVEAGAATGVRVLDAVLAIR